MTDPVQIYPGYFEETEGAQVFKPGNVLADTSYGDDLRAYVVLSVDDVRQFTSDTGEFFHTDPLITLLYKGINDVILMKTCRYHDELEDELDEWKECSPKDERLMFNGQRVTAQDIIRIYAQQEILKRKEEIQTKKKEVKRLKTFNKW